MGKLTPMMEQYLKVKSENPNCILFYRLGDFYEMFFEDAKIVSKELELVLTGRDCGLSERAPMCGVPYHAYENYAAKLVSKGYKVAIVEQVEDPAVAKGIVKREVVRILTPGTVIEGSMLEEEKNNYLCSVYTDGKKAGICFSDISTGEVYLTQFEGNDLSKSITNEIGRFVPREIVLNLQAIELDGLAFFLRDRIGAIVEVLDDELFDYENAKAAIHKFKLDNKYTQVDDVFSTCALGALLSYVNSTQINVADQINSIDYYSDGQFMNLDFSTRRNLELTETMRSKEKKGSLLWVLDKTKTSMGKRLIRSWVEQPLLNCGKIIRRHNAVEELINDSILRMDITEIISGIHDIERIMTRIVYGSANARELKSLSFALGKIPDLISKMQGVSSQELIDIKTKLDPLTDIYQLIENSITEEPPFTVREGGIIKTGYNKDIDLYREDMNGGKDFIAKIEEKERKKTGIPKLKIGYNRVFGYYIEILNSFKGDVPAEYIRKQTLTNCERYITQELKDLEGRILGASTKVVTLEYEVFQEIRKQIADELDRVQRTAHAIACLDVLSSFAQVSEDNNYTRPIMNMNGKIVLKDTRHPVIEKILDTPFVANDVLLDKRANRVAIITGPNMAGKSTYMRQIALAVIMAQMGCFVPAKSAEIGITDAVFTRIGASDDLTTGQSTFMVEMNEVAHILKSATSESLLILDEIGRGTSTFDGMSIARSVLEFVADKKKLGAKTLFATHYHELTSLEDELDGVKNYNIAVKKHGDDITFLRRIIRGGADDSYGIEVAKLAGIPNSVINRAKQILATLENGQVVEVKKSKKKEKNEPEQMMISLSYETEVIDKIKSIDINTMNPIEAFNVLFELTKIVGK